MTVDVSPRSFALCKSIWTPSIAPVIVFVALVTSTPSIFAFASSGSLICVRPEPPLCGYWIAARPPSPPAWLTVSAFAVPLVRAVSVRVAVPFAPLITVATTLVPASDELIAAAILATVLLVESMTTLNVLPPEVIVSVPVPTTAELDAKDVD